MRPGTWALDPDIVYLNHGAFGARTVATVAAQGRIRAEFEGDPVGFIDERLANMFNRVRETLAAFLELDPAGLVFVRNATTGVNTALRTVDLRPGDEILLTDHEYNACRNAVDAVALASGARPVVVHIPLSVRSGDEVTQRILDASSTRTRLLLIDHVTSQSAMVLPVFDIVSAMPQRVVTIVDGAHAPGMVGVAVPGADFITGNCHKWLCCPPGTAFLWVGPEWRAEIDPLVISHGWNDSRAGSRLRALFDWTGTDDPSAVLTIPTAIRDVGSLRPGGWAEIRERNRMKTVEARKLLLDAVGSAATTPDTMLGSMAIVRLPDSRDTDDGAFLDPLATRLRREHRIEAAVFRFPSHPARVLRVSMHVYNDLEDVEALANALSPML